MRGVIVLALGLLLLPGAPAATQPHPPFTVEVVPGDNAIALIGDMSKGVADAFRAALAKAPKTTLVLMETRVGNLAEGLALHAIIKAHGLDTSVKLGCDTICTVIFLAGKRRHAGHQSIFRLHRTTTLDGQETPMADIMLRGIFLQAGVADWFVDRILDTPRDGEWLPSLDELMRAGVATMTDFARPR